MVKFNEDENEGGKKFSEDESFGAFYLKHRQDKTEETNSTFVTLVPSKFHEDEEVIKAKEDEIYKW